MIVKLIKHEPKISSETIDETIDETISVIRYISNVKDAETRSTYVDSKYNMELYLTLETNEQINLILNDNNKDLYSNVYLMNSKGETIERLI